MKHFHATVFALLLTPIALLLPAPQLSSSFPAITPKYIPDILPNILPDTISGILSGIPALFSPRWLPEHPSIWRLALAALAEEYLFRCTLLPALTAWLTSRRFGKAPRASKARTHPASANMLIPTFCITGTMCLPPLTTANMLTSIIFALCHLPFHPPLWSMAALLPSLVLGMVWEHEKRLTSCWLVHFVYNLAYYYRPL